MATDILTRRELEVLEQAARGLSTQESSDETNHAFATIHNHRNHILEKLGAHRMIEAVAIAFRLGILS